ncbi:uncharacterized protein FA14DRAFT_153890 [Meira miltonrushii]|uniref:Amidohydrolase-related domain-containing protein n=1 Tax=Meira miltonrushii TaxID=1280837 RepID=A0A316VLS2_9BASI|nr:uncharacterized protein FA14DRAFT_153890 [Meira miltonrushii]PWN38569.1 hypothetical protein FA14DRAFT_153890 [Meira miltonrushii]
MAEGHNWIVDVHTHILPTRLAQKIRGVFLAAEGLSVGQDANHICCTPAYNKADEDQGPSFTDQPLFELKYPAYNKDGNMQKILSENGIRSIWVLPYAHKGDGMAHQLNGDIVVTCTKGTFETAFIDAIPALTVHPDDEKEGVRLTTLEALKAGCKAAKLHCSVGHYGILHPSLEPFWEIANQIRLPVIVHVGNHISGHTAVSELDDVDKLMQRYKHVIFVIAHSGAPGTSEAIKLATQYSNVYLDTTPVVSHTIAYPPKSHSQYPDLIRLAKEGKVLFGTDFPNVAVSIEEQIKYIFDTFATDESWKQKRKELEAKETAEGLKWWQYKEYAQQAGKAVVEVLGDAALRIFEQTDQGSLSQFTSHL